MQDPQEYVADPQLKRALELRLKELETLIQIAIDKINVVRLLELETEHQILATVWRVFDCSSRDSSWLDRKGIQPQIRPSILRLLPEKQRQLLIKLAATSD